MAKRKQTCYLKDIIAQYKEHTIGNTGAGRLEEEIAIEIFKELKNVDEGFDLPAKYIWGIANQIKENLAEKYIIINKHYFKENKR